MFFRPLSKVVYVEVVGMDVAPATRNNIKIWYFKPDQVHVIIITGKLGLTSWETHIDKQQIVAIANFAATFHLAVDQFAHYGTCRGSDSGGAFFRARNWHPAGNYSWCARLLYIWILFDIQTSDGIQVHCSTACGTTSRDLIDGPHGLMRQREICVGDSIINGCRYSTSIGRLGQDTSIFIHKGPCNVGAFWSEKIIICSTLRF
mmetsp:Transcript_122272/g.182712  ORF Transcript_122272/g.182712 Transcript_122272/m.182712 type:complete len:204 (-) Transcript_122272:1555-2166(-)